MNLDIFYFLYNFSNQSELFDSVIVAVAVYFPVVVAFLAGLFLLFHHEAFRMASPFGVLLQKRKEILEMASSGLSAYVVTVILKNLFQVVRPTLSLPDIYPLFIKTSFSFPSTHSAVFMALAVSIFLIHKKAGYWFILFALLIGLARVVAGVHYPADILGGFLLGTLVALLVKYFSSKLAYLK